nr:unnamed protein product [Meloidogyne enterolobii]
MPRCSPMFFIPPFRRSPKTFDFLRVSCSFWVNKVVAVINREVRKTSLNKFVMFVSFPAVRNNQRPRTYVLLNLCHQRLC